jgi:hypothetical protein
MLANPDFILVEAYSAKPLGRPCKGELARE